MDEKLSLVDRVLEQIQTDVADQNLMALAELLTFIPLKYLVGYLPEGDDE